MLCAGYRNGRFYVLQILMFLKLLHYKFLIFDFFFGILGRKDSCQGECSLMKIKTIYNVVNF